MKKIRYWLSVVAFPLVSVFDHRVGFSVFWPWLGGWRVFTHGRVIKVKRAGLESLEYFRHFLPCRGGLVLDVGGELGVETRQFSHLVGASGTVIVFECLPTHLVALNRIAENHANVRVVDKACWNVNGSLTFYVGHTPGSGTALATVCGQRGQALANTEETPIEVASVRLEDFWLNELAAAPVDFLKMDIEGAELEALEGAGRLLQKVSKIVVASYHLRDGVPTAQRVCRFLEDAGFQTRTDENLHVYGTRKSTL